MISLNHDFPILSNWFFKNFVVLKTFLKSSFIKSQFNDCPLICMFCSKKALHRLNNKHERFLRLTYRDYVSNFITLNQKCLEPPMKEIYKHLNGSKS